MSTSETTAFVRLRVEMVLQITDPDALTGTALESIAADFTASGPAADESAEERTHAEETVREDGAEALASLIDPFDLVAQVPGVELAQASWSSETIDYDPDAEDWTAGEDGDEAYYGIEDNETGDEEGGGATVR
ncbi:MULTISPECIES: hypothetical protein [Streptomyces]|uniref:DNA primase n=1 Tax=Streptomyces clavifer TaxID=68188 RepID=A0ABS4V6W3_9ACTN|nr:MULTISPECIES: hypothetical protein [Streptomyces]KQX81389.1 hypothetical protein ASD26_06895 [Streptomyces sp. Root1319]KQZ06629.1 hypothetical protein ASD51_10120 [Streptomyces sp. Root55]MBP2359424.1 hypothetical protein [Streptomyces clavifer]MDX2744909.1 hypothetical protein [Streptomyces sp. NRRL_B-2557]WRY83878.1 hypothetical protein OG388_22895 [Streptomyces clavifer]